MKLPAVAIATRFARGILTSGVAGDRLSSQPADGHTLKVSCFVACLEPATESGHAQAPDNQEHE